MTSNDLLELLNDGCFAECADAIRADPTHVVSNPKLLIKAVNASAGECVELLLQHGADANPTSDSPFAAGKSLLLMSIGFGDFDIARSLLAHGADPHRGFQGPPDYGSFLAKYAAEGTLTSLQFDALINDIRAGGNPAVRGR